MDFSTVVSTASAICALIVGGFFVYSHHAEQQRILYAKRQDVEKRFQTLEEFEKEISVRESKLQQERQLLEEQRASLKKLEEDLKTKSEEVEKRLAAVEQSEVAIQNKEKEVQQRQEEMEKQAAEREDEKTASTEFSLDDDDHHVNEAELQNEPQNEAELQVSGDADRTSYSEAEKRKKMIDDELSKMIKEANENELEDPFDEDSIEALKKAAYAICYLKKYYDVMKDTFIYFPSVAKTVVNYTLMEEAEKHYFGEDDEYPQDLSIGLRSVASMAIAEEDDDLDEDYMLALAQDVDL
jgi:DNA repair exonuclease SbcCD ATPase subunit